MDERLAQLLKSGQKVLSDTKARKPIAHAPKKSKIPPLTQDMAVQETDPHKRFVKMCVQNKPKKAEMLKDIRSLIEAAEAEL